MSGFRIFDARGTGIVLGTELGRGGEGAVYDIKDRVGSVAKIYLKAPGADHAAKLTAMARMAEEKLLRLAAWPTGTLHDASGSVIGFAMPKVGGHRPVFQLYGPKLRLREFPTADWRFLIHAAANAARAFTTMHAAGLVIGDVNHGNLLVSQDGTVRLIDCDSIQISKSGRTWLCTVGVNTHQPPEMQGLSSYTQIVRTPNHDNFGLAVIIFQLLCMARHPFSGHFLGRGEPPSIEEAIIQSRYAYARDRQRTAMEPPPGSLPIEALTPALRDLFEAAFAAGASRGGRPSADQWTGALQELGSNLRRCSANQAHYHLSSLQACPWCRIEAASGVPLFPVVFVAGRSGTGDLAALWQEVTRVAAAPPLPPLRDLGAAQNAPSPAVLAASGHAIKWRAAAWGSVGVAVLAALTLAPPEMNGAAALAIGVLAFLIVYFGRAGGSDPFSQRLAGIKRDWGTLRAAWEAPSRSPTFAEIRRQLDSLKLEHDNLPTERLRRLQQLSDQRRQKQMEEHLDRFSVTTARIPGIGPTKAVVLSSYGIDTAGDIVEARVLRVPGFGPATTRKLLIWRQSCERAFRFDPSRAISASDLATVERDIMMRRIKLQRDVTEGLGRLRAIANSVRIHHEALKAQEAELLPNYAQALADAKAAPKDERANKRLLIMSGAAFAGVLFSSISRLPSPSGHSLATAQPRLPVQTSISRAQSTARNDPNLSVPKLRLHEQQQSANSPTPTMRMAAIPLAVTPLATALTNQSQDERIVTRQAGNVRAAPDNSAVVVRTAPQGTVLHVFGRSNGWVQVGDDKAWGWIYSGLVGAAP